MSTCPLVSQQGSTAAQKLVEHRWTTHHCVPGTLAVSWPKPMGEAEASLSYNVAESAEYSSAWPNPAPNVWCCRQLQLLWEHAQHSFQDHDLQAAICVAKCINLFLSYTSYPDLQLALVFLPCFSAHSIFWWDLRSFWLFTLTWTKKRAFVSWQIGICTFYLVFTLISRKICSDFAVKSKKWKNATSGYLLHRQWQDGAFLQDSWVILEILDLGFGKHIYSYRPNTRSQGLVFDTFPKSPNRCPQQVLNRRLWIQTSTCQVCEYKQWILTLSWACEIQCDSLGKMPEGPRFKAHSQEVLITFFSFTLHSLTQTHASSSEDDELGSPQSL